MNVDRLPLFCDTALAERIERAEAQLVTRASTAARARRADASGFVIPLAGGVASFAEEDSPFRTVAGLGFGGVRPGAQVAAAFGARRCQWAGVWRALRADRPSGDAVGRRARRPARPVGPDPDVPVGARPGTRPDADKP